MDDFQGQPSQRPELRGPERPLADATDRSDTAEWLQRAAQQSRLDDPPPQLAELGRGLVRLNAPADLGGSGATPTSVGPLPLPEGAAGATLARMIAAVSARTALRGRPELVAASTHLRESGARPGGDLFFYTDLHAMNIISHAIEERVIADRLQADIYAGFQRLTLLRPQERRYRALLDVARYVCVYGLNDVQPGAGIFADRRLIRFGIDPRLGTGLEAFWFVVVDHPALKTALLAQHVGGDLWSHAQRVREYAGFWTFDGRQVDEIVAALRQGGRTLYYGG